MVRRVNYDARRRLVLEAAINKYIRQAEPIASEDIASDFGLSSATIRNIFAELEEAGYLTHLYTSGGRIPTDKGYRYYVDFLISQMVLLDDEEKERIAKEYKREIKRLEDALEETSEIISTITHYAGIVSFLEWQDRFFYRGMSRILEQPEFQDLNKLRILIKVIEDKQRLLDIINRDFTEKVKVYIGSELGCPEIENCSLVVSNFRFKDRPLGRLAVLGPVRMEYRQIIPSLEYISDVLTEVLDNI
jgi:transcriptional regulator of heat shock response